jgi:hypothetical protein
MTPTQFRKIALSFPDSVESEHMGHPDFRVGGKVFASLGAPSDEWAMVKLTLEQQEAFCNEETDCFQPCNGAWGRQGYTNVLLSLATSKLVRSVLRLAVDNAATPQLQKRIVAHKPSSAIRKSKPVQPSGVAESDDAGDISSLDVDTFIRDLVHTLKPVIESIRMTIMKSDKRISEGIKWNAPSFYCHGWFATLHLRAKSGVVLVLHHGAKVRRDSTLSNTIDDPMKLLTWVSADRATVKFVSASDFKLKQKALQSIVKQWVNAQVELEGAGQQAP